MRPLTLILVATLIAAACGGSKDTIDTSEPTSADGQSLVRRLSNHGDFPLQSPEVNCTANRFLADLDDNTVDQMLADPDMELTASDPGQTRKIVDAFVDCVDIQRMTIDTLVADGVTRDEASCVAEIMTDDLFRDMMEFAGEPDANVGEDRVREIAAIQGEIYNTCGWDSLG